MAGQVWSCGWGVSGQLGHGGDEQELTPRLVHNLNDVCGIAAGAAQTCAYDGDGRVYSWGEMEARPVETSAGREPFPIEFPQLRVSVLPRQGQGGAAVPVGGNSLATPGSEDSLFTC